MRPGPGLFDPLVVGSNPTGGRADPAPEAAGQPVAGVPPCTAQSGRSLPIVCGCEYMVSRGEGSRDNGLSRVRPHGVATTSRLSGQGRQVEGFAGRIGAGPNGGSASVSPGGPLAPATALRYRKAARVCIRRAVDLEVIDRDPWPPLMRGAKNPQGPTEGS